MSIPGLHPSARHRRSAGLGRKSPPERNNAQRWYHPRLESLEARCLLSITPSVVVGQYVFYDNSAFDGGIAGVNSGDDNAVASDKSPYLPNGAAAVFANVSSYSKGLDGVMVDLLGTGSHSSIGAADFIFTTGTDNSPSGWSTAPGPSSISVRTGAGVSGSDRVEIIWGANAVKNQWLEVQVRPTANTGLAFTEVFFWGSRLGDTGSPSATDFSTVVAGDGGLIIAGLGANTGITNVRDIDRTNSVTVAGDRGTTVANLGTLNRISLPSTSPPILTAGLAIDTGTGGAYASDGITTDPTVAGTVTSGTPITSFTAGLNASPATTNALALLQGDGTFTMDASFLATLNGGPLADGAYTLHLSVTDSQALTTIRDVSFTLKRSVATPQLPDLITLSDSGSSSLDNITNVNTPTISVTGEAGATIALILDNSTVIGQLIANPTVQFTLPALTNGLHTLKASAVDGAGNLSPYSASLSITISTVLPTVSASTLANFTDDLTPHITVTGSGPLGLADGTQIRLDVDLNNDGDYADAGEANRTLSSLYGGTAIFSLTPALSPTDLIAGPYLVNFRAHVTDVAGNEGTSTPQSLKVDTLGNDILKNYVQAVDNTYLTSTTSVIADVPGQYKAYMVNLKSQTWRSADSNKPIWQHWMQVIVPYGTISSTAFLLIDGGSTSATQPALNTSLVALALSMHGVAVDLPTVPNEPLQFGGDGINRSEDAIIAYTLNQYVTHLGNSAYETWPALLPMVKSAVRAMDKTQEIAPNVQDFLVSGYSKRGWTTWLTAAVDNRVKAVIPGVFDNLNGDEQMVHHYGFYNGTFSAAIADYTQAAYQIPQNSLTTGGQALNKIIDPYKYLSNGKFNVPKLLLNSADDEFFVPDSGQFYFDDLPGTANYVRYIPNVPHGLNVTEATNSTLAFYDAVVNNRALPKFNWSMETDGSIRVQVTDTPTGAPTVKVWASTNPNGRDFRFATTNSLFQYQSASGSTLTSPGGGLYIANLASAPPAIGASAFFVEFTFPASPGGSGLPYIFTTTVRVVSGSSNPLTPWAFSNPANGPSPSPDAPTDFNALASSLAAPVGDNTTSSFGSEPATSPAASALTASTATNSAEPTLEDWPWVDEDLRTRNRRATSDVDALDFVLGSLAADVLV